MKNMWGKNPRSVRSKRENVAFTPLIGSNTRTKPTRKVNGRNTKTKTFSGNSPQT
jgi:hypothetical protein